MFALDVGRRFQYQNYMSGVSEQHNNDFGEIKMLMGVYVLIE